MVDSFTNEPFKGNPAGVCLLENAIADHLMQSIAAEVNLSETAFVQNQGDHFSIRYFSPVMEIPLCGHATLAAAKVLFDQRADLQEARFNTASGVSLLTVRQDQAVRMLFPKYSVQQREVPTALLKAMGIDQFLYSGYNSENKMLIFEIEEAEKLRELAPDSDAMEKAINGINGVVVTAVSTQAGFDFESRYFWPWSGGDEDPVTGATHTFLAPYWAEKLGKKEMKAFQCSKRTGILNLRLLDDALEITGDAVLLSSGKLRLEI